MLRRLLATSLTVLLLHAQMPLALAKQNPEKEAKASAKMKEKATKLGVGAKIKVKLRGNSELKGTLAKVEESNLVVKDATGTELSAAYKDIDQRRQAGIDWEKNCHLGRGWSRCPYRYLRGKVPWLVLT